MKIFSILLLVSAHLFCSAQNITKREQLMIDEINYVRTKPAEYAKFIDEYLQEWPPSKQEKKDAQELYNLLIKMKPVPPLHFSPKLYEAAAKHGKYLARTKKFEHSKYNYGENLSYGIENIRHAVIDLLIDSGVPDRGHRYNILLGSYYYVAVYEAPNSGFLYVQEFAFKDQLK